MKRTLQFIVCVLMMGSASHAQEFGKWRYCRALYLNTSASGSDVKGDVRNFPMAVMLNAANFDFSQARNDGADIRFSTEQNDKLLSHHIEHWDRANQTALAWVKVAVVRGDNASQSIFLHWGNAEAADASDAKAVFDTKEGFVGVWHFSEESNSTDGGYQDATANAANGTGVNLRSGARAKGRLGAALELNYADKQWVKIDDNKRKLFDLTTRVTFSIWAKAKSYSNQGNKEQNALPGYETMMAKGDNSWRLQKFGIRSWHKPAADLVEICVEKPPRADLCVVGKTDMVTDKWFHFVGVHDYPKAKLYVNGVLEAVETFDVNWKSDDYPVGFGNQSQFPEKGRWWDGWLDEARVLEVVKDDHWIKLDYESQREGQKFLIFGPAIDRAQTLPPLPGKGLAQHPFLYSGQWDTRKPLQTMYIIRNGKVAWSYSISEKDNYFVDSTMLSNGNIVFARKHGVTEITHQKQIVWNYDAPPGTEIHSAQPVGKDKVLFMQSGNPGKLILMHKKTSNIETELTLQTRRPDSVHGQFRHVRMTRAGTFLVPHMDMGKVVEYDKTGRELWSVEAKSAWAAVRLKNGNTLISGNHHGYVREVNPKGETVWEINKDDLPGITLHTVQEVSRLANGNTVICNWVGSVKKEDWPTVVQIIEVTPDKKVVWALREWTNPDLGPASSIQLLDEPGIAEKGDLQR